MQSDPKIGILQGLVIGLPSTSAFARLFQFGMRLGMRSYTIGSAWWQGDCGPYWGHNAVLRLQPFIAHCELSALPDGGPLAGHVLSHDQIEAVLMRRAGYEVRVLARGESRLRGEPADPDRIHPPRPALVPGQHAILELHRSARPARRQPLPARLRHPDVPRFARLDRPSYARRPCYGACPRAGRDGQCRGGPDPVLEHARNVVRAAGRDRPRRACCTRSCGAPSAARCALRRASRRPCPSISSSRRSCGLRIRSFSAASCSAATSAGSASGATITGCRCRWPCDRCGRRPRSAGERSRCWPLTHPAALPYALILAGGLALAVPFAVVTSRPEFGAC